MKKYLPIIGLVILLTLLVAPAASAAPPAWGGDCGGAHHCVKWGETLYSIGRMYNKSPHYLAQVNGLYNPNRIYAGQVLYIPSDGPSYPWYGHKPAGCWGDCDYGYGQPRHTPYYSHGYNQHDYYYKGYYPEYKRSTYTCGYYGNCY